LKSEAGTIGEAGTIEDENQEHQHNNIDILKRQGSAMTLPFLLSNL